LENGGADCIVICTNTMHKIADDVQKNVSIPLLVNGGVKLSNYGGIKLTTYFKSFPLA